MDTSTDYYMHEFDLDADLKASRDNRNRIPKEDVVRDNVGNSSMIAEDMDTSFDPTINVANLDPTDNVADPALSSLSAAAAAAAAAIGKPQRKRVSLDTEKLLDPEKGLDFVMKNASKRIRISKRNTTLDNLTNITQFYQLWAHGVFPKAKFKDFLLMTEKLGTQIEIKSYRRELYMRELEEGVDTSKYDKNVYHEKKEKLFVLDSDANNKSEKLESDIGKAVGNDSPEDNLAIISQELGALGLISSTNGNLQKECENLVERLVTRHIGSENFFGVNISRKYFQLFEELEKINTLSYEEKLAIENALLEAIPSSYTDMVVALLDSNKKNSGSIDQSFVFDDNVTLNKNVERGDKNNNDDEGEKEDDDDGDGDDDLLRELTQTSKPATQLSASLNLVKVSEMETIPTEEEMIQSHASENEDNYDEGEDDEMALMREYGI